MTKSVPTALSPSHPPVIKFLRPLLLIAALSSSNSMRGQAPPPDAQPLAPGAPIERELSGGQTHVYRVAMSAGQFALIRVEQRGANAVLDAKKPDGAKFAVVDLRIDKAGVEPLAIVADEAGEYTLRVISTNPKAAAGRYEARLDELRQATAPDRVRVKAQTLSFEAGTLSVEQNPETKRKAVQLYEEALPLWRQTSEPLWEAAVLWRLGRLHIELTEFARAKEYFSRSVIARRSAGDRRGEASARNGVCEALHYLGDIKAKAECLDALTPVYREFGERLEEAKVLSNVANAFRELGDFQAALRSAQQALVIFEAERDQVQQSFALNSLGQIYRSLNEHQLALDHYERALAIRREGTNKRLLGLTLGDIGEVYDSLGDFQRAQDYFNQSLTISEELGDRRTKAIRLQSIGRLWERMGDAAKALDAQTQSLALARAVGDRRAECLTLIAVGDLYLNSGEEEKARRALAEALELARATGDPVGEAAALSRLGLLAAKGGDSQRAIDLLQQSLALARATGGLQDERDALLGLARTERERNNLAEARDYHEKALQLTESLRAKILRRELRASYLATRQDEFELYVDLLMQMHRRQPQTGHDRAAFEISERARARGLLEALTESRADIRQGVERALLIEEHRLIERLRDAERRRAQAINDPAAKQKTAQLSKEVDALLGEHQSLQGRIRAASPRYAALTQPRPVTAAQIQTGHLDDHTVLLEFALGADRSWLWAVTPDAVLSFELPPRREIEVAARAFYETLTARQPRKGESFDQHQRRAASADAALRTEGSTLSRMLLGPIAAKLGREWKGKRLLVVASGALEYVPFAALPIASGDGAAAPAANDYHPLIADHEIVNLPSASALAVLRGEAAKSPPGQGTLAILADPVFEANDPRVEASTKKKRLPGKMTVAVRSAENSAPPPQSAEPDWARSARAAGASVWRDGLSRLPFSREEAAGIANFVAPRARLKATDFKASHELAVGGELARYRIVHFATHGVLNSEHPELSGLVLSLVDENGAARDGFLRMHEVYNLRLPAEVVVLSACQTALGKEIKGEGLVGLTRGFMYAGAQRVVASLWQVDDLATAELMAVFYRGMLKEGKRPAAALRDAQLTVMKDRRWRGSPYFWAGFVLQGEYR